MTENEIKFREYIIDLFELDKDKNPEISYTTIEIGCNENVLTEYVINGIASPFFSEALNHKVFQFSKILK